MGGCRLVESSRRGFQREGILKLTSRAKSGRIDFRKVLKSQVLLWRPGAKPCSLEFTMWLQLSRVAGPFQDPLLGKLPAEDRAWHLLKKSNRMRDYEAKLVIDWGPGKKAWRQRASNKDKTVLELRAHFVEEPFPRYLNFKRRLGDLKNIYPSWRARLEERKGIYLLVFDDGMQYVGSATGERGFWQRWESYLANGHGGNRVLMRDGRDARNAVVSLLEVSGSSETDHDIVRQEMFWQRKLGSRAKPLETNNEKGTP